MKTAQTELAVRLRRPACVLFVTCAFTRMAIAALPIEMGFACYDRLIAGATELVGSVQGFPQNYVAVVRDAREAAQAALSDGCKVPVFSPHDQ